MKVLNNFILLKCKEVVSYTFYFIYLTPNQLQKLHEKENYFIINGNGIWSQCPGALF